MTRPETPDIAPEDRALELHETLTQAFVGLFEADDRVSVRTHSGGVFDGTVEGENLSGLLLRTTENRLFFLPYVAFESAEIFETQATDDDGDPAAEPNGQPLDVTPIGGRAA